MFLLRHFRFLQRTSVHVCETQAARLPAQCLPAFPPCSARWHSSEPPPSGKRPVSQPDSRQVWSCELEPLHQKQGLVFTRESVPWP